MVMGGQGIPASSPSTTFPEPAARGKRTWKQSAKLTFSMHRYSEILDYHNVDDTGGDPEVKMDEQVTI